MGSPDLAPSREQRDYSIVAAIETLLRSLPDGMIEDEHIRDTPARVCVSFDEYFAGCYQDPTKVLGKRFPSHGYDEMVFVNNIPFVSFCAHHLVPFMGKVHFAYIPKEHIVGLSKIPRLVECFAKRPQVQEKLTQQLVNTFQEVINPKGCGVVIEAFHLCMAIRGIKKEGAYTRTQAIRRCFRKAEVKAEFLDGVSKSRGGELWP